MITAILKRDKSKKIVSITLKGHALSGAYGQDTVCAAVSSLAINTFNSIEKFAHFSPIYEIDAKNGGFLYLELAREISKKQAEIAELFLESLWLGLESIYQTQPEFLKLILKE